MSSKESTSTSDFASPWEEFPSIPRFSIGWRMGAPEEFLMSWHDRYSQLDKWERRAYRRNHRRPFPLWIGFYALESESPIIFVLGVAGTVFTYFLLFAIRIAVWPFAADRIKLD